MKAIYESIKKFLLDTLRFVIIVFLESAIEMFIMNPNSERISITGIKMIKRIYSNGGSSFNISGTYKCTTLYILFIVLCILIRVVINRARR